MRHGIIIYDSWATLINELPDDKAIELVRMIFAHAFDNEEPTSKDATVNAMYLMIRDKVDEDIEAWERTRQARSEAGKKGNEVRWSNYRKVSHSDKSDRQGSQNSQKVANVAISNSISISKDIKKDIRKKKTFTPPTLEEIETYCSQRGNKINPKTFYDYYTAGGWKDAKGNPVRNWKQKIITWEKHEPTDKGKVNKFNTFEQNTYDFEELERMLITN